MNIRVGQKVAYPNHGVCKVEAINSRNEESGVEDEVFYSLRVLATNSSILVPRGKAETIGIRPVIKPAECVSLIKLLATDFDAPDPDWKVRARDFAAQFQTGDIFAVADVLKKLTYLARTKTLSFREQRMIEKAKFLPNWPSSARNRNAVWKKKLTPRSPPRASCALRRPPRNRKRFRRPYTKNVYSAATSFK